MKRNIIIALLLFIQTLALPVFSQEEKITLKTPSGDIFGTLLVPESSKTAPVVLFVSGSGPTDRDGNQPMMQNNAHKMMATALAQNGIASVRFDKRAIAESHAAGVDEKDLRFEHYVSDVADWIDLLANDKRFSKVIVAGHSEGSLIGMAAITGKNRASGFISLAGAGRPADVILKDQLKSQPDQLKDMIFPMIDKLKQGDTIANVQPMLYSLFRPSVQPYLISWFKFDPTVEIKKIKIPILILQGTTDVQVTGMDAMTLALSNPTYAKSISLKNMNHVLKNCESTDQMLQVTTIYNNPDLPLHSELVPAIVEFIKGIK